MIYFSQFQLSGYLLNIIYVQLLTIMFQIHVIGAIKARGHIWYPLHIRNWNFVTRVLYIRTITKRRGSYTWVHIINIWWYYQLAIIENYVLVYNRKKYLHWHWGEKNICGSLQNWWQHVLCIEIDNLTSRCSETVIEESLFFNLFN